MSQSRGAIFLTAFALSGAAEGRRESWFIPGSGCGTVNAIKRVEGSPTLEEEARGCIYVTRDSHSKLRGNLIKAWLNYHSKVARRCKAEVVSTSRKKIHQARGPPFT